MGREVLQTIPKFCFPFDVERVSQNQVGQNFTFVLTDIDGKQRFGFCRLTQGCRLCVCLLSYLPWFEIFYKLLNTLADYLSKQQSPAGPAAPSPPRPLPYARAPPAAVSFVVVVFSGSRVGHFPTKPKAIIPTPLLAFSRSLS
uniref:UDENN domain-containing protein n=1 Tax=Knipowitschia caucasica TaxID=637954 RepID=A0AAV2KRF7_KNICA